MSSHPEIMPDFLTLEIVKSPSYSHPFSCYFHPLEKEKSPYFFRALRRAMTAIALLPRSVTEVRVDAVKPRVDEEAYRRNLSYIASETKRLGIPLIFLLLKDNPIQSHYLNEGIEKLTRSDKMAIEDLILAVDHGNMFSDLARIYLAKAYQTQGNTEKAAEVVISRSPYRSLHGGYPVRLDTVYTTS